MLLESYHIMMDQTCVRPRQSTQIKDLSKAPDKPPFSYFFKCLTEGHAKKTLFTGS